MSKNQLFEIISVKIVLSKGNSMCKGPLTNNGLFAVLKRPECGSGQGGVRDETGKVR